MKFKKILFSTDLSIQGYKETLEEYLLEKFEVVDFLESGIPLRKERNVYFKVLRELYKNNLAQALYRREIIKYAEKKLKKDYYDYFLVVAGAEFSTEFLQKLRDLNKRIKLIIFIWDKLETTSLKKSICEFDEVYTFDKEDAKIHNFKFLSSFYINECRNNFINYKDRKYDIYYLGSLRDEERYKFLKSLNEYSTLLELNSYLKLLVTPKNIHNLPKNYIEKLVIKNKINYIENLEFQKNSKVILELLYGSQTGLTLRTIESIATETKLITTNRDVVNYDFYNSENIFIIKDEKDILNIPKSFFEEPYKRLDQKIVEKYSVKGFIDTIFNDNI